MLEPRDTATREDKALDGLWRFALDADGRGRQEECGRSGSPAIGRSQREIAVPASYNDLFASPEERNHVGDVRYQTSRPSGRMAGTADRAALRGVVAPVRSLAHR